MESPSQKILIAGYYGFGNAGDELILRSLLRGLRAQTASQNIAVLSARPEETRREHGVRACDRWSPAAVLRAVLDCRVLLFGGGGLLQDKTGTAGLWYYLLILWTAILCGKDVRVAAAGIGPLEKPFNRYCVRAALDRVSSLSVRDAESKDALVRMGVRGKISLVPDPVLTLDFSGGPSRKDGSPRFVFILRDGTEYAPALEGLARELLAFAREQKAELHLAVFHPLLDEKRLRGLRESLRGEARVLEWKTLDELAAGLSGMDLVVGMRYHALVLAALMDIPFAGVDVDPKIRNFCAQFEADGVRRLISLSPGGSPGETAALLRQVYEKRAVTVPRIKDKINRMRKTGPQQEEMNLT